MFDRKSYYKKTKAKQLDNVNRWRKDNPEKFKAQKIRSARNQRKNNYLGVLVREAKSRAKRKGITFTITKDDLTLPTCCPVLGIPIMTTNRKLHQDNSPSIDRKIPSLGYVPGNVQIISWRANRIKCDATPEELQLIANYYAQP